MKEVYLNEENPNVVGNALEAMVRERTRYKQAAVLENVPNSESLERSVSRLPDLWQQAGKSECR